MKTRALQRPILLASLLTCGLHLATAQASLQAKAITAVRAEWVHDLENKLLDPSMALYSEDAVFFNPGGPRVDGRAAIRQLFDTVMKFYDSEIHMQSTNVSTSGTLAYDSGNYDETLVDRKTKATMKLSGCYLMVLRREPDGHWRIVQHMWTEDKPK